MKVLAPLKLHGHKTVSLAAQKNATNSQNRNWNKTASARLWKHREGGGSEGCGPPAKWIKTRGHVLNTERICWCRAICCEKNKQGKEEKVAGPRGAEGRGRGLFAKTLVLINWGQFNPNANNAHLGPSYYCSPRLNKRNDNRERGSQCPVCRRSYKIFRNGSGWKID